MSDSKSNNPNIKLLQSLVDSDDAIDPDDSDYRFIVDGRFFKYVTVAPEALGDWNKGYVAKDYKTGDITFITTEKVVFPAVKHLWHPVKLNELDFSKTTTLRQRVYTGTNPEFHDGQPVLLKLAVWPYEITDIENETTIYEYIHGQGIGPGFLGHLTEGEDGRVMGIVIEWVPDARPAELGDLEGCRKTLSRLHDLGIKLGDTNKFNFLVREGHEVVLIDFETAQKCSPEELEDEMNNLKECLADTSFRGGVIPDGL